MSEQTNIERYIEQVVPIVREFRSYDEFKAHVIGQLEAALLDSPFDITWARSVLPDGKDGVTDGRDLYQWH